MRGTNSGREQDTSTAGSGPRNLYALGMGWRPLAPIAAAPRAGEGRAAATQPGARPRGGAAHAPRFEPGLHHVPLPVAAAGGELLGAQGLRRAQAAHALAAQFPLAAR